MVCKYKISLSPTLGWVGGGGGMEGGAVDMGAVKVVKVVMGGGREARVEMGAVVEKLEMEVGLVVVQG